jgi:ribosomal protein S18 acetylase RimI-like enzyme
MLQVRLAQLSDAPELKKLNDLFNGEDSNTVEAIKKSLGENSQEIVCVACENNGKAEKLIGFCCGQIINSMCYSISYGDITEFFVMDKYQQQGVGKQLVEFIEIEFSKRGVNHLHHYIGRNNTAMQELYHSMGYLDSTKNSYKSSSMIILEKDTDINPNK